MMNIMEEEVLIWEKLILFWYNYFVVNNVNDLCYIYCYFYLIRFNVWGNFRDLVKNMMVEFVMFCFLNGN